MSADVVSASIGGASMGANIIKASNVVRTSAEIANSNLTAQNVTVRASNDGSAEAFTAAAGAALVGITTNSATALAQAAANAIVSGTVLTVPGTTTVEAISKATATASIASLSVAGMGFGIYLITAENTTETEAQITNSTVKGGDVSLTATSDGSATAVTTATSGGVVDGGTHVATAIANATTKAIVSNTDMDLTGSLSLTASDASAAAASVKTESYSGLGMGVYLIEATNTATTAAQILNASSITAAGSVSLNATSAGSATATTAATGGSLLSTSVHIANATAGANTSATVENSKLDLIGELTVIAEQLRTEATATSSSSIVSLGGAVGTIKVTATTSGLVLALVDNTEVASCSSATIEAKNNSDKATATVTAAGGGVLVSVSANSATATTNHTTTAAITGGREFHSLGTVTVSATDSDTDADASVNGISVGGVKITASKAEATVQSTTQAIVGSLNSGYTDSPAVVEGLILTVGKLEITAYQQSVVAQANSTASGGSLVAGVTVSTANATTSSRVWAQLNAQQVSGCADGLFVVSQLDESIASSNLNAAGIDGLASVNVIAPTATAGGTVSTIISGTALGTVDAPILGDVTFAVYGQSNATASASIANITFGASFGDVTLNATSKLTGTLYVHNYATAYIAGNLSLVNQIVTDAEVQSNIVSISGFGGVGVYTLNVTATPTILTKIYVEPQAASDAFIVLGMLSILSDGYAETDASNSIFAAALIGTATINKQTSNATLTATVTFGGEISAGSIYVMSNLAADMYASLKDSGGALLSYGQFEQIVNLTKTNSINIAEGTLLTATEGEMFLGVENDLQTQSTFFHQNVGVTTYVTGSGGGLVDVNKATSTVTSKSKATITIGDKAQLSAAASSLGLQVNSGSYVDMDASYTAAGGFATVNIELTANVADTAAIYINGVTLDADTDKTPLTMLKAVDITLYAVVSRVEVNVNSYSKTTAAASSSNASSIINLAILALVQVGTENNGAVYLQGYNSITVQSYVVEFNVYATAYACITAGLTGETYSCTQISGWNAGSGFDSGVNSRVVVNGENGVIRTATLDINATAPTISALTAYQSSTAVANTVISYVLKAFTEVVKVITSIVSKIPLIGKWLAEKIEYVTQTVYKWVQEITMSTSKQYETGTMNNAVTATLNGRVYLGISAGASVVIHEDGSVTSTNVQVTSTVDETTGDVTVGNIAPNVSGTLQITVTGNGSSIYDGSTTLAVTRAIYGNALIIICDTLPELSITNEYVNGDVIFGSISTTNASLLAPSVYYNTTVGGFTYETVEENSTRSDLVITNTKTATVDDQTGEVNSLLFSGNLYNHDGTLTINANGWNLYTKYGVTLFSGGVSITDVHNVAAANESGNYLNELSIYLFRREAEETIVKTVGSTTYTLLGNEASDAEISLTASGDILLSLTLAQLAYSKDDTDVINALLAGGLTIGEISTTNGDLVLSVENPVLIVLAGDGASSYEGVAYLAIEGSGTYVSVETGASTAQTISLGSGVSLVVAPDGSMTLSGTYSTQLEKLISFTEDGTSYYQLPNGVYVLMDDASGAVLGVIASGAYYENFDIQTQNGTITFTISGVDYTIQNGVLTAQVTDSTQQVWLEQDNDGNWVTSTGDTVYLNEGILMDANGNIYQDLSGFTLWGDSNILLNRYVDGTTVYYVIGVVADGTTSLSAVVVASAVQIEADIDYTKVDIDAAKQLIQDGLAQTFGENGLQVTDAATDATYTYYGSPITTAADVEELIYQFISPSLFIVSNVTLAWTQDDAGDWYINVTYNIAYQEGINYLDFVDSTDDADDAALEAYLTDNGLYTAQKISFAADFWNQTVDYSAVRAELEAEAEAALTSGPDDDFVDDADVFYQIYQAYWALWQTHFVATSNTSTDFTLDMTSFIRLVNVVDANGEDIQLTYTNCGIIGSYVNPGDMLVTLNDKSYNVSYDSNDRGAYAWIWVADYGYAIKQTDEDYQKNDRCFTRYITPVIYQENEDGELFVKAMETGESAYWQVDTDQDGTVDVTVYEKQVYRIHYADDGTETATDAFPVSAGFEAVYTIGDNENYLIEWYTDKDGATWYYQESDTATHLVLRVLVDGTSIELYELNWGDGTAAQVETGTVLSADSSYEKSAGASYPSGEETQVTVSLASNATAWYFTQTGLTIWESNGEYYTVDASTGETILYVASKGTADDLLDGTWYYFYQAPQSVYDEYGTFVSVQEVISWAILVDGNDITLYAGTSLDNIYATGMTDSGYGVALSQNDVQEKILIYADASNETLLYQYQKSDVTLVDKSGNLYYGNGLTYYANSADNIASNAFGYNAYLLINLAAGLYQYGVADALTSLTLNYGTLSADSYTLIGANYAVTSDSFYYYDAESTSTADWMIGYHFTNGGMSYRNVQSNVVEAVINSSKNITFYSGAQFIGGELVYQYANENGIIDYSVVRVPGLSQYLIIDAETGSVSLADVDNSVGSSGSGSIIVYDENGNTLFTFTYISGSCTAVETATGIRYYIDENGNYLLEGSTDLSTYPGGVNSELAQLTESWGSTTLTLDTIVPTLTRASVTGSVLQANNITLNTGSMIDVVATQYDGTTPSIVADSVQLNLNGNVGESETERILVGALSGSEVNVSFATASDTSSWMGATSTVVVGSMVANGQVNFEAQDGTKADTSEGAVTEIFVNDGEMTYIIDDTNPDYINADFGTLENPIQIIQADIDGAVSLLHIVGLVKDVYILGVADSSSLLKNGNLNLDFVDGITGNINITTEGTLRLTLGETTPATTAYESYGERWNITVDNIVAAEVELIAANGAILQTADGGGITADKVTLVAAKGIGTSEQALKLLGSNVADVTVTIVLAENQDLYLVDSAASSTEAGETGSIDLSLAVGEITYQDTTDPVAENTNVFRSFSYTAYTESDATSGLATVNIISNNRSLNLTVATEPLYVDTLTLAATTAADLLVTGDVYSVNGTQITTATGDAVISGSLTSDADITITAIDGDVLVAGDVTSNTNVSVTVTNGSSNIEGAVSAGDVVRIEVTGGDSNIEGDVTAENGDVTITVENGSSNIEGDVLANGAVNVTVLITDGVSDGGSNINGSITAQTGDVTLKVEGGASEINGAVTAQEGDVTITVEGGGSNIEGAVTAENGDVDVAVNGGDSNINGTVIANDTVTIQVTGGDSNVGTPAEGESAAVDGSITASNGNVTITVDGGDSSIQGTVDSGNDILIDVDGGNVNQNGSLTAERDVIITTLEGDVTVDGSITANRDIIITTQTTGNVTVNGLIDTTEGDVRITTDEGNVTLTGGDENTPTVSLGAVDADGNPTTTDTDFVVTVNKEGDITIEGYVENLSGDMELVTESGDISQEYADISGDVVLSTGNGNITTGDLKVGGSLKIRAISYDPDTGNVTIGRLWVEGEDPDGELNGTMVEIEVSNSIVVAENQGEDKLGLGDAHIAAHTITLISHNASVGSSEAPLLVHTFEDGYTYQSGLRVEAQAEDQGIYVTELAAGGSLNLYQVLANKESGHVELIVQDGNLTGTVDGTAAATLDEGYQVDLPTTEEEWATYVPALAHVQGETIELFVQGGGIGIDTTDTNSDTAYYLNIDTGEAGRIDAFATQDIWLEEVQGDMRVGQIISLMDIHLRTVQNTFDDTQSQANIVDAANDEGVDQDLAEKEEFITDENDNVVVAGMTWQLPETLTPDVLAALGFDEAYLPENIISGDRVVNLFGENLFVNSYGDIGTTGNRLQVSENGFVDFVSSNGDIFINKNEGDLWVQQLKTGESGRVTVNVWDGGLYGTTTWQEEFGDRLVNGVHTVQSAQRLALSDSQLAINTGDIVLTVSGSVGEEWNILGTNATNSYTIVSGENVYIYQPTGDIYVSQITAAWHVTIEALSGSILAKNHYYGATAEDSNITASDITLLAGDNIGEANDGGESYDIPLTVYMTHPHYNGWYVQADTVGIRAMAGGSISIFSAVDLPVDFMRTNSEEMRTMKAMIVQNTEFEEYREEMVPGETTQFQDMLDSGAIDADYISILNFAYNLESYPDAWGSNDYTTLRVYTLGDIINHRTIGDNVAGDLLDMEYKYHYCNVNFFGDYVYLHAGGQIGTEDIPVMLNVTKALSLMSDGDAYLMQQFQGLNLDKVIVVGDLYLSVDLDVTMDGTYVEGITIGPWPIREHYLYVNGDATIISRYGSIGSELQPFVIEYSTGVTMRAAEDIYLSSSLSALNIASLLAKDTISLIGAQGIYGVDDASITAAVVSILSKGNLGTSATPISVIADSTLLNVLGDAYVAFKAYTALSGSVGGTANVTGTSLYLNNFTVAGLAEFILSGKLSGSFNGTDLLLNVGGDVVLATIINQIEAMVGGSLTLENFGDLIVGGLSEFYQGIFAQGDVWITVHGKLILLEEIISTEGVITLIADAIYDADGNRLDIDAPAEDTAQGDAPSEETKPDEQEEIPEELSAQQAQGNWYIVLVGALVLFGLMFWFILVWRRKKEKEEADESDTEV
ncbi:MAG: hypothetical protein R3Y06_01845 [Faecalibacterium sp.]